MYWMFESSSDCCASTPDWALDPALPLYGAGVAMLLIGLLYLMAGLFGDEQNNQEQE
jgi:hypothetical protein